MNQCRSFHAASKRYDVLRADYVCAEPAFKSWIECDVARGVDDDVDIVGDCLSFFFAIAKVGLADVTTPDYDLVANETLECVAVSIA